MQTTKTTQAAFVPSYKAVKSLLSKGSTNAKTAKNELETHILYLAPANKIGSHNICPFASPGCIKGCLDEAGRGIFSNVQEARKNKTKYWAFNREGFYIQLAEELIKLNDKAFNENRTIAIRLNGTSDLDHLALLKRYSGIDFLDGFYSHLKFYDYTKSIKKFKDYLDTNYHLTFSLSEINKDQAIEALKIGGNIAVVFRNSLPAKFMGFDVINGDLTDYRPSDPQNVIVGLVAKGKAKKDISGFVID